MLHCDLRVQWKVASDLRFRAAISGPKTLFFCRISGDLALSTRKSLAIAIVRFWRRGASRNSPSVLWIWGGPFSTLQVFYEFGSQQSKCSTNLGGGSQQSKCSTNLAFNSPSVLRIWGGFSTVQVFYEFGSQRIEIFDRSLRSRKSRAIDYDRGFNSISRHFSPRGPCDRKNSIPIEISILAWHLQSRFISGQRSSEPKTLENSKRRKSKSKVALGVDPEVAKK